jgi:integrase
VLRLEDTKEGASVRPIGRPAFEMPAKISKREGCPFGAWERIARQAKLVDVTPHTLRHSFASVAGDLGFTESTIAAILGHAAGSVTSRYVHHLDSVLIAAADKTARAIYSYMRGG